MGNLTTSTTTISWSQSRAGFSVPSASGSTRAVSQQSVDALAQHLSDEVSIEFFISNPTNPGGEVIIAGFGNWAPGTAFPRCDNEESTVEGGWRMYSALGNSVRIQVLLTVNGVPGCFEESFVAMNNVLRHCVLRVRSGEVSLVSHGGIDVTNAPGIELDATLWKRHLTFATPQPNEGWLGSVFMFAVFDRYMSTEEVAANREFGPPNSLAVATTSSLAVTEDVAVSLFP